MSRFSPQVLPQGRPSFFEQAGEGLEGLADALESRRQRRRQETQDTEAEQDRTRRMGHEDEQWARDREQSGRQKLLDAISLHESGYRDGSPPPDDSAGAADAIANQRGNGVQASPAYAPPPQTTAPDTRGNFTAQEYGGGQAPGAAEMLEARRARGNMTPGGFGAPPAAAAPAPVQPSLMRTAATKYYQLPGQGGYIDESATPEARKAAAEDAVAQRDHGYKLDELGQEHGFRGQEEAARYGHDEAIHAGDQAAEGSRNAATVAGELATQRLRNEGDAATERIRNRRANVDASQKAEAEEAEGDAFLNTTGAKGKNDPLIAEFGRAFQGVRAAHPKWAAGRVAYHAKEAIRQNRPELFPQKPAAKASWQDAPAWQGGGGADSTGTAAAGGGGRQQLSEEEKARARTDAGFREFLSAKGYKEGDY